MSCECKNDERLRCPTCMRVYPVKGELQPDTIGMLIGLFMGSIITYMIMAWLRG